MQDSDLEQGSLPNLITTDDAGERNMENGSDNSTAKPREKFVGSTQADSEGLSQEGKNYPTGIKLCLIMLSVYLAIFLVALVISETF
jgi:hypothetical protein